MNIRCKKEAVGIFIGFILILLIGIGSPSHASAVENSSSFSVSPVIPEDQENQNYSYFDLLMRPNEEKVLEVNVSNSSDKEITVFAEINVATTNSNVVVDYSWNLENELEKAKKNNENEALLPIKLEDVAYDSTLEYPIPDFVKGDKEIKIPAQSSKKYKLTIQMPSESFDGVLLGGIRFIQKESEESAADQNVQIKNRIAYVIGLLLRENDKEVKPSMILNQKKIVAGQINGYNKLLVNLQNETPVMLRDVTIKAEIRKKGSDEVLHSFNQTKLRIAPNSNFNLPIDWENQPFKAGEYTAAVTVENKAIDGEPEIVNQKWHWDEAFTIESKQAKAVNEKAVVIEEEPSTWSYNQLWMGLFVLVFLGLVIWIVRLKKKLKK